tara:strand:- start:1897 stop:2160 length:264 start_codon:yes stop_codon:yes gene_type:complete
MTDLELTLKALNEGILPSFNSNEIAALLETCDPEDARRMKRKFRKLWRRERKNSLSNASTAEEVKVIDAMFSLPVQRRNLVRKKLLR